MSTIIDTHVHLDDSRFDRDRKKIIERMEEDGLKYIINIGAGLVSSRRSVELAQNHQRIFAAVGVHPHDADSVDGKVLAELRNLAQKKKVVAIGETGLDFHYDNSPRDIQKHIFRAHIRMAAELDLPLVIHTRQAMEQTQNIIREEEAGKSGGIMHCFNGDLRAARFAVDNNFLLGIGGLITFGIKQLEEVVQEVSLDKIVLETDAPYLTPEPHRGKRNQPAYTSYIAEKVARIKGISAEEVKTRTTNNARWVIERRERGE
ncbi:MAG: TatD family hydrolase [Halanaerobiaceae bacterium]